MVQLDILCTSPCSGQCLGVLDVEERARGAVCQKAWSRGCYFIALLRASSLWYVSRLGRRWKCPSRLIKQVTPSKGQWGDKRRGPAVRYVPSETE